MGLFDFFFKSGTSQPAKVKRDIYDFFSVDVRDIFKYNPTFQGAQINAAGSAINNFVLKLAPLELQMFSSLDIILHPDNEKTLVFRCQSPTLSKPCIEFVNFYANVYGPDLLGQGKITDRDLANYRSFSRLYPNMMINYDEKGGMELSLLSVPNSATAKFPEFKTLQA